MTLPGAGGSSSETVRRSTALALVMQLTTAAFTAVLTLFLVRELGPEAYGVFALGVSLITIAMLLADFGVSLSAARFIAQHRNDPPAVSRVLAHALALKLVAGVVVAAVLVGAAQPLANAYDVPALAPVLRVLAIALFGQSLLLFFQRAFIALGRVGIGLRMIFSESVVELVATIGLVLTVGDAFGAALGRAAGYAAGGAIAVVVTVRRLGRRSVRPRLRAPAEGRRMARYAGALVIVDGAYTLFTQVDSVMIGGFLGPAAVGKFEAPLRLITFLHYPGLAVANGVTPRLAPAAAGAKTDTGPFLEALRWLVIFQATMLAPVIVWSEPIVTLILGESFAESAEVLRALAPFVFLAGIAPVVALAVNYLGEARRRVPIAILTVALNAGIDAALIPKIGILAGAIGTDVAYALYVPAHLWICQRVLGLDLRRLGWTLLRSIAAAAAMALPLLAFGTSDVPPLELAMGGLAGAAAFAAVLVVTGEVSIREIRRATEALRRRMR